MPGSLRKYYAFHSFEAFCCDKEKAQAVKKKKKHTHRKMRDQISKVGFLPHEL